MLGLGRDAWGRKVGEILGMLGHCGREGTAMVDTRLFERDMLWMS